VATRRQLREAERLSLTDVVEMKRLAGARFPYYGGALGGGGDTTPDHSFNTYAGIYKSNGVVFACMAVRQSIFAEISFTFAERSGSTVGKFFDSPALDLLHRPWPNGTTGELATRMIQDADLSGNFYAVVEGGRLYRRSPETMSIVLDGDPNEDEFVNVAGYVYRPGGDRGPSFTYLPHEVCHWTPLPDPQATYRGMSWLTPILREIKADNAATDHKAKFFENGATPNLVVTFPESVMNADDFAEFKRIMDDSHGGAGNAYKTLYLAPGADATPVGADFTQLAFDSTQGRDEARVASAAGVPAVIVGIKESLQGSSLNTGNYSAARRRFADGTMKPLYRSAAAALETLVSPPDPRKARLWFDDSQVAFFREDRKDSAEIQSVRANTIRTYTDAGFTPESAVAAATQEDPSLLQHSGLYSVQLQEPGSTGAPSV
jgi:phage portal protein BeeE